MKVLLVARAGIGGAARHVLDVVEGLSSRHRVLALASPVEDPEFPDKLASAGATVHPLHLSRSPDPARDLRAISAIRTEIDRFRPDVVHAHTAKPGALARAAAGRTPVVYSPHGFFHDYPTAPAWARRSARAVERRLAARTTVLAVCSEYEMELAEREGLAGRLGTVVVPNGVAPPQKIGADNRDAIRREFAVPEESALVLMAARLAKPKEPRVFLDAAALLPEACFVLAGDGPLLAEYRRTAPRNALLTGPRDDVGDLLVGADVAVLATRYEAGPYFVLEAMAAGVPVVATDLPTIREMVGDAGLLSPPGEADAMARAIGTLVLDPVRRRSMAECALQRTQEQHSIQRMLEATERAWSIARGQG